MMIGRSHVSKKFNCTINRDSSICNLFPTALAGEHIKHRIYTGYTYSYNTNECSIIWLMRGCTHNLPRYVTCLFVVVLWCESRKSLFK